MITDDEVLRVFERADPARIDDDASVVDTAGYLDALRTRSSDVPIIETTPTPTEPTSRHRRPIIIAAAAAAAVVLIVIGAVALATRDDTNKPVTDQPPVATETPQTAAEVAQSFVEAYGDFDVDRAFTYLADDADITGLIDWFTSDEVPGTRDELRLLISLQQAQSYQQMRDSCDELSSSATGTIVRCTFDFQALRSDELGLGPYSGNFFDLTVRDGQIVRAWYYDGTEAFSPQVWEPFARWMEVNHPQDAAIIFSSGGNGARLTAEAIPLWEQLTREYVAAKAAEG